MSSGILLFVVRKAGGKSRDILSTGKPGKGYQGAVSIRHIEVPEAKARLEQALALLLAAMPFSNETTPTDDMVRKNHNRDSNRQDG